MRVWVATRACAIAAALTVGSVVVHAQGSGATPQDCRDVRLSRVALDKRKDEIERKISGLRSAISAAPAQESRAKALVKDLRRAQEDLLDVVFQLDCLRPARMASPAPPPPPAARVERSEEGAAPAPPKPATRSLNLGSPGSSAEVVEVTAYYATNRARTASPATPADFYANDPSKLEEELAFGRAVVTIPLTHAPGTIELPSWWKLERTADPRKHFVLKAVTPLGATGTQAEIADKLRSLTTKSMLVYVHGYNMGFQEAALRTAQLAHDLKFPGVAFFYSWPSANRVRSYLQDEEAARISESVFEQVLDRLSALPVDNIYIVAHSMGNRVVGHGLQAHIEKGKKTSHIKELLLAAPDINADLFKRVIAPRLAEMQGTRTTIYASSSDLALIASKVVHGFRRVGETSGGVLVFPGMETIDASNVSSLTRGYGHSYLVDSTSVLNDLHRIIADRLAAKARGLSQEGASPDVYWRLP